MATRTLISLEEYEALPEMENGVAYELGTGELLVLASLTLFHNRMRDDIDFVMQYRGTPPFGQGA